MKAIPYGRQDITEEDIEAVITTLKSDYLTQGPAIAKFEEEFASYVGSKYAVAVSNGTAALHLAAIALNVNAKSKVITTSITFAASANCVEYCGGEVVFADIDPQTGLIDINSVRSILEAAPKGTFDGIIPVDFTGRSVDMESFHELAKQYGLWILEDACHAPGGFFEDSKGKRQNCGNGIYADMSIFSFHPVKHIACGEGGMITTNNKELYEKLCILRTHGITKDPQTMHENHGGWFYEMQMLGYNYRMTDIQASLGISQLKRAAQSLSRRQEIAIKYQEAFKNEKIKLLDVDERVFHAYHLFVILSSDRKGLYEHLRKNGIYAQVHYCPVHLHPYYQQKGWKKGDLPHAEKYYEECLSLPMYPTLTDEEQDFVITKILEFING